MEEDRDQTYVASKIQAQIDKERFKAPKTTDSNTREEVIDRVIEEEKPQ